MRVMVLSTDRRFREVIALLLARRGCEVAIARGTIALAHQIEHEQIDVLMIDAERSLASAATVTAAVESLSRPVGIVVVDERPEPILPRIQALPKWGSFDSLFSAIEQAHAERERPGLLKRPASDAPSPSGAAS